MKNEIKDLMWQICSSTFHLFWNKHEGKKRVFFWWRTVVLLKVIYMGVCVYIYIKMMQSFLVVRHIALQCLGHVRMIW